jgi:phytoene/squalene synthetase
LPKALLAGLDVETSRHLPQAQVPAVAQAVRRLLAEADTLYRSGDAGLPYLAFRSRVAVAAARQIYSAIGDRILANGADVLAGRAVVPTRSKVWRVGLACATAVKIAATAPRFRATPFLHAIRFPEDVLPF